MGIINDGFKVFDPRLMTSFSQSNFKHIIKRALFKTLRGKARLKGAGELVSLYPYLESETNKMGVAGVIKWGSKLMMVPVSTIENKGGKPVAKHFFNKSKGHNQYLTLTRKRFILFSPQDPDGEDWAKVNDLWNKDIMGYIALPKSAQDVSGDKMGIDPNKIQLQVYQPENKGRDLWADYRNFMREILWKHGIPFDILEDKKERASVSEVEEAHTYFDNITNERRQCRLNFISWVKDNWGGDYELIYK